MKHKALVRVLAIILALLLLWWLYWAVLVNEDSTEDVATPAEQVEAVE